MPITPAPYPGTGNDFSGLGAGIDKILRYLISPDLQKNLFLVKIVFMVISVFFLFAIVYLLIKSDYLGWRVIYAARNFLSPKATIKRKIERKWEKVKNELEKAKTDVQWKIALIDGLDVFNNGLHNAGFVGKSLREKVEKITAGQIPALDELKQVLPLCENLIVDPGYYISKKNAEKIIDIFEKILKKLEVF